MKEIRARLHLPEEVEAWLKEQASLHMRDFNDEIVAILAENMRVDVARKQKPEIDTFFSQGRLYPWIVTVDGSPLTTILADTADHACDYICKTRWISRLKLSAHSAESEI